MSSDQQGPPLGAMFRCPRKEGASRPGSTVRTAASPGASGQARVGFAPAGTAAPNQMAPIKRRWIDQRIANRRQSASTRSNPSRPEWIVTLKSWIAPVLVWYRSGGAYLTERREVPALRSSGRYSAVRRRPPMPQFPFNARHASRRSTAVCNRVRGWVGRFPPRRRLPEIPPAGQFRYRRDVERSGPVAETLVGPWAGGGTAEPRSECDLIRGGLGRRRNPSIARPRRHRRPRASMPSSRPRTRLLRLSGVLLRSPRAQAGATG